MSLNRATIAGRLAKNLELRHTQSGVAVASFTLAVEGDFKDKQTGERPVYWVDCIAWRERAEFMSKYLCDKGRVVIVDGHLQTRAWSDKEGNKRKSVEVVADNVYFGDSKRDGDSCNTYQGNAPSGYGNALTEGQFSEMEDGEDMPF